MIRRQTGPVVYYQFASLSLFPCLAHAVTTRLGAPGLDGFTMGLPQGLDNRRRLGTILGIKSENLVLAKQVHGNAVAIVDERQKGRGALASQTTIPQVDALITAASNIPLMVLSADCPLIGIYDSRQEVIAVAHAGWRGTLSQIAIATVTTMQRELQCRPEDCTAVVTPSIGPCCFEVGDVFLEALADYPPGQRFLTNINHRHYFDLWAANAWQLQSCGITKSRITCANLCSCCNNELFYSYRREGGSGNRFALVLCQQSNGKGIANAERKPPV